MRLDVYFHGDPTPHEDPRLAEILNAIKALTERINHMANEIDDMTAAIEENTTVDGSVKVLLAQLTAQLATMGQNATDLASLKAALAAKVAELRANNADLSAAVVANTPAAP